MPVDYVNDIIYFFHISSGLKKTKVKSQPFFSKYKKTFFSQKTGKNAFFKYVVAQAVKKPWFLYHLTT